MLTRNRSADSNLSLTEAVSGEFLKGLKVNRIFWDLRLQLQFHCALKDHFGRTYKINIRKYD